MLHIDEIGSGVVQRLFRMDSQTLYQGHKLTHEQLRKMPPANRNALIDRGFIRVIRASDAPANASGPSERFVISRGFGRFEVVEGRKLTAAPVDKATAYELAGKPPPSAKE